MRYMLDGEAGAMTDDPEHVRNVSWWIFTGALFVFFAAVVAALLIAPGVLA
jgi:hypothetical protein